MPKTSNNVTQDRIIAEAAWLCNEENIEAEEALPWAVMRIVEGHDHFSDGARSVEGVTVGYGRDRQMYESDQYPDEWWERFPPVEGYRFRLFFPEYESGSSREYIERVRHLTRKMTAIGAIEIGSFADDYDSYGNRCRECRHYVIEDQSVIHDAVRRQRG
jgi:hypothetical protein